MAIDLAYLKKRAEFLEMNLSGFDDEKVRAALGKINPPTIAPGAAPAENSGFECVVKNKALRNWLDLVPETDRGFMRFIYEEGTDRIEKYLPLAMTGPAFEKFRSHVAHDNPSEEDLFLMRRLIWDHSVLGRPVGVDFGIYEMNMIFNSLPVDVARSKMTLKAPSFADFYRMIKFAEWGLANAG
ncbi:MAG: hypothetical protein LBB08_01315 [Rickettsiales bacterium]|jgi:hypothetical protein|nr:hypothetical protein [Rickettsiales bacterium]